MGFQTPQHSLKDLLPRLAEGEIQLPDFQRGYVWEENQVRELLVTIASGFPLGVIMTLQTGNDQVRFKPTPVSGAEKWAAAVEPKLLILDGQQRLTSLTQALWGDGVVEAHDKKRIVKRRFYIDVEKAVAEPDNIDMAVRALPVDGILKTNFNRDVVLDVSDRAKQLKAGLFPLWLSYTDEGTTWLFEYADSSIAKAFLNGVLGTIKGYAIPSIELDQGTSKEAVSTVFEKVNQGGTRLTVFELLTAKFAGDATHYTTHHTDFRLKDDWKLTQEVICQYPVLGGVEETEFLQGVSLLTSQAGPKATTARKEDILRLDLSDYIAWAGQLRQALKWVAGFLDEEHIHVARDVPYTTQLVPLATLRVLMGTDIDIHGVRKHLRQWFWCGVLGELYSSATETRMANDLDQVPAWVRQEAGAKTPRTVVEASFQESRLHRLKTRNAAAYKGIHALLMGRNTRDWLHNQPFDRTHFLDLAVDIHHIFPKAWCLKNHIDPVLRESIVNKTPLSRKTNGMLSGASPADYMKKLDDKVGLTKEELDALVAAHCIDVQALRSADFEAFFVHRREALLSLIEEAMGKPAARDIEPADDPAEVGSSEEYLPEPDDMDPDETEDEEF